ALTWLLRTTSLVSVRSWPAFLGMSTTWTEPLIIAAVYCVSRGTPEQVVSGVRPPHGFGPAPDALALVMTSWLPSGVTDTALRYHGVGIKPRTPRASRSTTAIAFSPASAT